MESGSLSSSITACHPYNGRGAVTMTFKTQPPSHVSSDVEKAAEVHAAGWLVDEWPCEDVFVVEVVAVVVAVVVVVL